MTSAYCDETEGLARPMQLIRRDNLGRDVDTLDIYAPQFEGQGVTLAEGYKGFYHADATVIRQESAYRKGSRPSDIPREKERILEFTLGTQAATPAQWEDVENRLWKFWSFKKDCVLRLYSHRSEPREILVRKERAPDDMLRKGPGLNRFAAWKIIALACDPDWQSQELRYTVKRSEMTSIGGGVYEAMVPIQNFGDQPTYPLFASNQLEAPTTVWLPDRNTGRIVQMPTLSAGREFLVRTDPLVPTLLTRDNSLQWAKLNARAFDDDPIPESLTTPFMAPLRIQGGTANTEITMYTPQRWQRCWGGEA
ncbi:hypothetical protein CH302_19280 [Rhodococcus sp. 15-2388-1-1a]|uniref:hypothetical protein n=1 Tax=Nocardiaceae TaxID=85025 RepID=UPI00055B18E4|nr:MULTISPECIES: hypothetical protein [Rhodococcus]OZE95084.1 hypothetical protein CH302_19280 [Rhodococcus sp. 15-2388-1-1a]